jgi:hypothetical protein
MSPKEPLMVKMSDHSYGWTFKAVVAMTRSAVYVNWQLKHYVVIGRAAVPSLAMVVITKTVPMQSFASTLFVELHLDVERLADEALVNELQEKLGNGGSGYDMEA